MIFVKKNLILDLRKYVQEKKVLFPYLVLGEHQDTLLQSCSLDILVGCHINQMSIIME